MEEDTRRKHVLKIARASIRRDAAAFTVAAVYRKAGLSRSQFRRMFSTKAKLLEALAHEIGGDPPSKSLLLRPHEIKGDWLERRLRILERAITSLEVRIESDHCDLRALETAEQKYSSQPLLSDMIPAVDYALHPNSDRQPSVFPIPDASVGFAPTPEPPPRIEPRPQPPSLSTLDATSTSL